MTTLTEIHVLADWVQQSSVGTAISESVYLYPAIEALHLLGLSVSVGLIAWVDLRLLELVLRDVPAIQLLRAVRPWALGGYVATFVTGCLLLIAEASTVTFNAAFIGKVVFMLVAGLNAAYFELRIATQWPVDDPQPPRAARYFAASSLLLWALVVALGRLIPNLV